MRTDLCQSWLERHKKHLLPAAALSVVFTLWFTWYRGLSTSPAETVPMLAACFALAVCGLERASKRCDIVCALFALVIAFFQIAGHTVRTATGETREWTPLMIFPLLFMGAAFFVFLRGLVRACEKIGRPRPNHKIYGKKLWLAFFAALVALWLPALLVLGPRISPDSANVISQALGGRLNDSHPVAYTLLFRLLVSPFWRAGSVTLGTYIFCFLQSCFVAGALSYSLYWLNRRGCALWCCCLGAAYFTFTTVFSVNVITIWKDIPFNACLLLFMLLLYDNYLSGGSALCERGWLAKYCALSAAICFLRGVGWAIVLVTTLLLFAVYRARARKLLLLLAPLLVAVKLITGPLYTALGVQSPFGVEQSASVPMQQLARVVATGGSISQDELAFLDNILDRDIVAEVYVPISPDYIKGNPSFNREFFNENFGEFLRVWFSVGLKSPTEYLNAWLYETLSYWHVGFIGRPGIYFNDLNGFMGINQTDLLSPAAGTDLTAYLLGSQDFISLAAFAMTALFAAALAVIRKDSRRLIALSPPLMVWLGLMLGAPTYYDSRYMLVLLYSLPVLVFFALSKREPRDFSRRHK